MEYITTIRNLRRIFLISYLVSLVMLTAAWAVLMFDLMQYFTWALPGFSPMGAGIFAMGLIGIMDVIAVVFFLIPAIALSIEIGCEKKKIAREEAEWEAFIMEMEAREKKATKPKKKPAAKKKK